MMQQKYSTIPGWKADITTQEITEFCDSHKSLQLM